MKKAKFCYQLNVNSNQSAVFICCTMIALNTAHVTLQNHRNKLGSTLKKKACQDTSKGKEVCVLVTVGLLSLVSFGTILTGVHGLIS